MYINAAGFNIAINFHQSDKLVAGGRLKKDIAGLVDGFVLKRKPDSVDFNIEIKFDPDVFISKESGKAYAPLYKITGRSSVETNFSVSLDQFNTVLMYVVNSLLIENQGFILHCSAARIGGENFVFTGEENAGKSTIVKKLSPYGIPLADDSLLSRKISGKFFFFQSPLLERNHYKKTPGKFEAGRVFILRKSSRYAIEKLGDKSAVARMLPRIISLNSLEGIAKNEIWEKFSPILKEFIKGTEFYYLYCGKNGSGIAGLLRKFRQNPF